MRIIEWLGLFGSGFMEKKETIWSFSYFALLIMNFVGGMGQMVGGTILPLYARDLGVTAGTVGIIVGAFAISALAIRPFAGPAMDSFPKKPLLLGSFLIMCITTLLYPLATNVVLLFLVRFFYGLGLGCTGPLGLAMVAELVPMSRLASGISIYALSYSVSQAIGPAFGLWCKDAVGYNPTFLLSGALIGVSCILIALMKFPERDNRPPFQLKLDRMVSKEALIPTAIVFLMAISFTCTGAFMAIYGDLRGISEIGLYFTVYAVCLLATRPVFGRIADTKGVSTVLIPAILAFALSYILVGFADDLPLFLVAAAIAACGYGVASPLVQSVMVKVVPDERRGAGSNTMYFGIDAANLVGPVIGGFVIELLIPISGSEVAAYSNMWFVMLIPIALALVFYLMTRERLQRLQEATRKADLVAKSQNKKQSSDLDD